MEKIKEMSIDLETYSDVDIKNPAYTNMPNLRILKYYYLRSPSMAAMSSYMTWPVAMFFLMRFWMLLSAMT